VLTASDHSPTIWTRCSSCGSLPCPRVRTDVVPPFCWNCQAQLPASNTFARWAGDPNLAPVGTGSHIDAIPSAGRYDGTVGVLGGLEAIRALQRAGFQPERGIELLMFASEEPTRFGSTSDTIVFITGSAFERPEP
jgi:hypothetical protein